MRSPFEDPFRINRGPSTSEIFQQRGGVGRGPRKPEPTPEPDIELIPSETPPEEAPKADKVILWNPRWEVEKVGFNEDTDISVEAFLPASQAHKTRVQFELFAKTPDGTESISKAEGHIQGGKAMARIPVYIPQYRNQEGLVLSTVDYFFSARHSASNPLRDESVVKRVEEMAARFIECHILEDAVFAEGKSQILPDKAPSLRSLADRIAGWRNMYPDGKLAIFGHADAEGQLESNKNLTERRAGCIHAFLMKDAAAWDSLAQTEKWDPKAVPDFQAFMKENNSLSLSEKIFEVIDGKPYAGCGEYNQVESKPDSHATNRRVAVFLLKAGRNFPIWYPCKQGAFEACQAQAGRKGERRTVGFKCLFYDKLVTESMGSKSVPFQAPAVEIEDILFAHDSALPFLSAPDSSQPDPFHGLNAYAEALAHLSRNPALAFRIYGHADTSGSEEHNLELSRRRAVAVKAILDGEAGPFVKVAEAEKDNQVLLHYLDCFQRAFEWPLDAGGGEDADSTRVSAFQEAFNADHEGILQVDGKIGPKTWGAIFHLLKEQIGLLLEAKLGNGKPVRARYIPETGGIEACGEKFPLEASTQNGFRSRKNRRVEIAFLPTNRPRPTARRYILLDPIPIVADKPIPKAPTGTLTGIEVSCERNGKTRVAPPGVDLEIVADPVTGDTILLSPRSEGKVPAEWEVSGWGQDKYHGKGAWKTKVRGFKRPSEQFWIPHFNPHVVTVKASGPDGRVYTKNIKVYPGDKASIKGLKKLWFKRFESVMKFFEKYLGKNIVEVEWLSGSLSLSCGFKEAKNRPEVFWGWELEAALAPIIGAKLRLERDVVPFMNFIPKRVKKHIGQLVAFIDFKGAINCSIAYNRKEIDYQVNDGKFKGGITMSVGMEAKAPEGKKMLLRAVVQGSSGFSVVASKPYNDDKGIGFHANFEFPGIMAEGAFELLDGWVTTKYSAVLIAKHEFEPIRLGTDAF